MWKATLATILTSCTPLEDTGSPCGDTGSPRGNPAADGVRGRYYPDDTALAWIEAHVVSPGRWSGQLRVFAREATAAYLGEGEATACIGSMEWEGILETASRPGVHPVDVVGGGVLVDIRVDGEECGTIELLDLLIRDPEGNLGDMRLGGTGLVTCEYTDWGHMGD